MVLEHQDIKISLELMAWSTCSGKIPSHRSVEERGDARFGKVVLVGVCRGRSLWIWLDLLVLEMSCLVKDLCVNLTKLQRNHCEGDHMCCRGCKLTNWKTRACDLRCGYVGMRDDKKSHHIAMVCSIRILCMEVGHKGSSRKASREDPLA